MNFEWYAYMRMFHAYLWMFPSHLLPHQPTHPSRKGAALRAASTKGGAALRAAPPFVDSFLDGCVWAGEAADAMETSINMHETCACMHI